LVLAFFGRLRLLENTWRRLVCLLGVCRQRATRSSQRHPSTHKPVRRLYPPSGPFASFSPGLPPPFFPNPSSPLLQLSLHLDSCSLGGTWVYPEGSSDSLSASPRPCVGPAERCLSRRLGEAFAERLFAPAPASASSPLSKVMPRLHFG